MGEWSIYLRADQEHEPEADVMCVTQWGHETAWPLCREAFLTTA
jgi:hypothetical protein